MGLGTSRRTCPRWALPIPSYLEACCVLAALLSGSQAPWLQFQNLIQSPHPKTQASPALGLTAPLRYQRFTRRRFFSITLHDGGCQEAAAGVTGGRKGGQLTQNSALAGAEWP